MGRPLSLSPKPPFPTPYRGLGGEFEGRVGDFSSPSPPLTYPLRKHDLFR